MLRNPARVDKTCFYGILRDQRQGDGKAFGFRLAHSFKGIEPSSNKGGWGRLEALAESSAYKTKARCL